MKGNELVRPRPFVRKLSIRLQALMPEVVAVILLMIGRDFFDKETLPRLLIGTAAYSPFFIGSPWRRAAIGPGRRSGRNAVSRLSVRPLSQKPFLLARRPAGPAAVRRGTSDTVFHDTVPIAAAAVSLAMVMSFPLSCLYELGGNTIWAPAILHFTVQSAVKVFIASGDSAPLYPLVWMIVCAAIPFSFYALEVPKTTADVSAV